MHRVAAGVDQEVSGIIQHEVLNTKQTLDGAQAKGENLIGSMMISAWLLGEFSWVSRARPDIAATTGTADVQGYTFSGENESSSRSRTSG